MTTADGLVEQQRTADATVTVIAGGAPLANRQVTVAQRSHKFLFGCIGFDMIRLANGEPAVPQSGAEGGLVSLGEAPAGSGGCDGHGIARTAPLVGMSADPYTSPPRRMPRRCPPTVAALSRGFDSPPDREV
jgi:hypothetical protein